MFVGCAVSGAVILVGNGAKAQGALMRDVMAYLLSLVTVVGILLSGRFTWPAAGGLLCMYIGFVAIVFCADMYHIASTCAAHLPIVVVEHVLSEREPHSG